MEAVLILILFENQAPRLNSVLATVGLSGLGVGEFVCLLVRVLGSQSWEGWVVHGGLLFLNAMQIKHSFIGKLVG